MIKYRIGITYDIWFENSNTIWNLNSKVKNLLIYLFLVNIKYLNGLSTINNNIIDFIYKKKKVKLKYVIAIPSYTILLKIN